MEETVKELSTVFQKDMKVGDEMIVLGSHVRIDKIELVVHVKIIDNTKRRRSGIQVTVPMTNFENPFPYQPKK